MVRKSFTAVSFVSQDVVKTAEGVHPDVTLTRGSHCRPDSESNCAESNMVKTSGGLPAENEAKSQGQYVNQSKYHLKQIQAGNAVQNKTGNAEFHSGSPGVPTGNDELQTGSSGVKPVRCRLQCEGLLSDWTLAVIFCMYLLYPHYSSKTTSQEWFVQWCVALQWCVACAFLILMWVCSNDMSPPHRHRKYAKCGFIFLIVLMFSLAASCVIVAVTSGMDPLAFLAWFASMFAQWALILGIVALAVVCANVTVFIFGLALDWLTGHKSRDTKRDYAQPMSIKLDIQ